MEPRNAVVVNATKGSGALLRITTLPRRRTQFGDELWAQGDEVPADPAASAFEVVEGAEYCFEWENLPSGIAVVTEPVELFEPDTSSGIAGRLKTRLATGNVDVRLLLGGVTVASFPMEVRSRKLEYRSEYRWMLRDIANAMTELIMQRFAASRWHFAIDGTRSAQTLYQQFEFLRAALDDQLREAFRRICSSPHSGWEGVEETAAVSMGVKGSSTLMQHLSRPGRRRVVNLAGRDFAIPEVLPRTRVTPTTNTAANRFVQFALMHWRDSMLQIASALVAKQSVAGGARAHREVMEVVDELDSFLREPLFNDVGALTQFPSTDQVLQRREGYRDFFRSYIEFELAALLSWDSPSEDYRAGQRDVSELYEYWAFLQLGALIGEEIGQPFIVEHLLQASPDGLSIGLRSGRETMLKGAVVREGRRLDVELCFNRTFRPGLAVGSSWTRLMRPDFTLSIAMDGAHAAFVEPILIHFDAKYRVQTIEELFGEDEASMVKSTTHLTAKRDDLLKMHAYRDAIHRSAGAYVIYPGSEGQSVQFNEFHELLPGLGAFVLRPADYGAARGSATLKHFLGEVLTHAARRFTSHERSLVWMHEIYAGPTASVDYSVPPGDSSVLLGFVKNRLHWDWILKNRTYNLRASRRQGSVSADALLLRSQLLVIYCPSTQLLGIWRVVGDAELVSEQQMLATAYPAPSGDYRCVQISELKRPQWIEGLDASAIDAFVVRSTGIQGMPVSVPWSQVDSLRKPKT